MVARASYDSTALNDTPIRTLDSPFLSLVCMFFSLKLHAEKSKWGLLSAARRANR
jgi:hypothetical protein